MRPLFSPRACSGGVAVFVVAVGPYPWPMPPDTRDPGSARSAAVVNEEIRALWLRAGGRLSPEERRKYETLVVEWAAAVRAEVVEAA